MEKIRILFMAASPEVAPLQLDEEFREIEAKIRASEFRDALEIIPKLAVRPEDLQQALLIHRPHILHFSGHGSESEELMLLDSQGEPKPVSKVALTTLLRILKDNLRLVVLNACFSRPQAEAITQIIDCAVGMNKAVGDQAARLFAATFYLGIGFGRSVQVSFDLATNALMLEGIPEENTPELLTRTGVDPAQVILIERSIATDAPPTPVVLPAPIAAPPTPALPTTGPPATAPPTPAPAIVAPTQVPAGTVGELFRDFAERFGDSDRRAHFKYLNAYKQLHLTLHDLQRQQVGITTAAKRRGATGDKFPDDLLLALRNWRDAIDRYVKQTEFKGEDEQGDWIKRYRAAVEQLSGNDPAVAVRAAEQLTRLPGQAHGKLNAEIVKCSKRLHVDELIGLLEQALTDLSRHPTAAQHADLQAASQLFVDSCRHLITIIGMHDHCQKIEDSLRETAIWTEGFVAVQLATWPDVSDWLAALRANSPEDFRVARTHAAALIFAAAATRETAQPAYQEFYKQFVDLFLYADQQVLAVAMQLQLAAEELTNALSEVMP